MKDAHTILARVKLAEVLLQETIQHGDHIDSRLDTVEAKLKEAERDLLDLKK